MSELHDYALDDLDLENKTVLDAAVGAGRFTRILAERIDDAGGTSRIIGGDNDLPSVWRGRSATVSSRTVT